MRNIKLTIEYDGSRYQGWARLGKDESGNTISNKITEVLKRTKFTGLGKLSESGGYVLYLFRQENDLPIT